MLSVPRARAHVSARLCGGMTPSSVRLASKGNNMTEAITLDFIGSLLRTIQAEQRTLRTENELIRKEMGRFATRDELLDVLRAILDRIGTFEAMMDNRIDQMEARADARFDALSAQIAGLK